MLHNIIASHIDIFPKKVERSFKYMCATVIGAPMNSYEQNIFEHILTDVLPFLVHTGDQEREIVQPMTSSKTKL